MSNLVEALLQSYVDLLTSRGVPEDRARDMAERSMHAILECHGGRAWYLPRRAALGAKALEERNNAIRAAHRRNVPMVVIMRTFRVSRARVYQVLKAG